MMISIVNGQGISDQALRSALTRSVSGEALKKILLIPPDTTRSYSYAGKITKFYYELLNEHCHVDVLPALGTHAPMRMPDCAAFLEVPFNIVRQHDWRSGTVKLGEVPEKLVTALSNGLMTDPIPVEVNKILLDPSYDLIVSIGQVVPHEVVGMANYSKNILVGCGGKNMINSTHMLGAYYGIEQTLGQCDTPVRRVFDYAEEHFLSRLPLLYVLTVTTQDNATTLLNGLFIGRGRAVFEEAARLSRQKNITYVNKAIKKMVVNLDEHKFKSMWLGNKAIYRTRMAIADGGELIILAPGVERFGEDALIDRLIQKYGYTGRDNILNLIAENSDLRDNLSAAAHLIHGSPEGRFSITYATDKMTKQAVERVGFRHRPLSEALILYEPLKLKDDGYNTLKDGSEVYYISNPALGLWVRQGLRN